MEKKRQVSTYWLPKVVCCAALFAFWAAKCDAQLGTPPTIAVQPVGITVPKGATITLSATAVSSTPMSFSWNANGHGLSGQWVSNYVDALVGTVTTLTIKNSSPGNSGSYFMTVSNAIGCVTSSVVSVTVLAPIAVAPLTLSVTSNSPAIGFGFQVSGPQGSNFVVEASSDLNNWTPIFTNKAPPAGTMSYTDTDATNYPSRFYRARFQ